MSCKKDSRSVSDFSLRLFSIAASSKTGIMDLLHLGKLLLLCVFVCVLLGVAVDDASSESRRPNASQ